MALPEESGSWERHAWKLSLHHCGHLQSLRLGQRDGRRKPRPGRKQRLRTPARVEVSELRVQGYSERQWPRLALELAELAGVRIIRSRRSTRCPLVTRRGLTNPRSARGSSKDPAQIAHHVFDAQGQKPAPCRLRRHLAKASSRCVGTSPSSQAAGTGQQKCNGRRRRCKLRLGCDLLDVHTARPLDSSRDIEMGGPRSLH